MKLPGLGSWRRPQAELDENSWRRALEWIVDLHHLRPRRPERMAAMPVVDVRTASEEFTAAMLGWPVRTFRVDGAPGKLGWAGRVSRSAAGRRCVGRRERLASRRAQGLVLQRHDHWVKPPDLQPRGCRLPDRRDGTSGAGRSRGNAAHRSQPAGRRRGGPSAVRCPHDGAGPDHAAASRGRREVRRDGHLGLAVHRRGVAAGHRRVVARHRHSGWPARDVHDATCSIGTELAACGAPPVSSWAATSTTSGSRWRGTTSERISRCAGPMPCTPSAGTPSSCWTPPAAPAAADASTRPPICPLDAVAEVPRTCHGGEVHPASTSTRFAGSASTARWRLSRPAVLSVRPACGRRRWPSRVSGVGPACWTRRGARRSAHRHRSRRLPRRAARR